MRLFLAVSFPDPVRKSLAALTDSLRVGAEDARFTREENFHLTLVFLGEQKSAGPAEEVLDSLSRSGFALTVGRSGRFSRPEGDLIFLRADGGERLLALQREAEAKCAAIGVPPEKRAYRPHVTLARGFRAKKGFEPEKLLSAFPPLSFPAERVSLMLSEFKKGKLCYTELRGVDLGR